MGNQVKSSRPRITYAYPPVEPFKSTPLIEIPDTPQKPQYYSTKDFEEEKSKLMRHQGKSSKPKITQPYPLVEPFKSTPLIGILDAPQINQYYTTKDFEEEKSKLWALHIELKIQYEDRLRKAIMYFVNKIDWPTLYEHLVKVINTWDELKENDDALKPIVNKQSRRN